MSYQAAFFFLNTVVDIQIDVLISRSEDHFLLMSQQIIQIIQYSSFILNWSKTHWQIRRVKITEFFCNFHSVYWNTKFDQEEIGLAFLKYWFLLSINVITFPSILYIQISLAPYLFIYFLTNLKNSSIVAWLIFSQAWMKFSIY